mmetsp:Transcript_40447/g.72688  ORF Transcript_40447/g.72688 Transcript_40447/m.72688 type:complete len:254 (-) Transcript_40447:89-850(-)
MTSPASAPHSSFDVVVWAAQSDRDGNGSASFLSSSNPPMGSIIDSFTQLGLQVSKSTDEETFSWAIAGPSEMQHELLSLKRQLEKVTVAVLCARQLGCSSTVNASPALLEVSSNDFSSTGQLRRSLTNRTRLLVCLATVPGPQDTLVNACLESSTDLIVAGPDADSAASQWKLGHDVETSARSCGTRLVLLRGLAATGDRTLAAVEASKTLLDPSRSRHMSLAGVHECFWNATKVQASHLRLEDDLSMTHSKL